MIVYTVNGLVIYETRADKPAQDWTGKAEYILDDHDPADAELIGKIKALAPFLLLTTQNGRIVDAVDDAEARKAWEATHPSTPNTWQQLLEAVNELRNTGLDPSMIEAKVAAAVSKYLEENPITSDNAVSSHNTSQTAHSDIRSLVSDLTERLNTLADSDDIMRYTPQELTEDQKAQACENIGALSAATLHTAINNALAEAKESGDFDGDDYVLKDPDKQEIAELAAELIDDTLLTLIGEVSV